MGELGVAGLVRRRGGIGGVGTRDGGGGGGGGLHSHPTHLGHGFSLLAWKVDIVDPCQEGNVRHIVPVLVPALVLSLSHCIDMRSDWDKAPDN